MEPIGKCYLAILMFRLTTGRKHYQCGMNRKSIRKNKKAMQDTAKKPNFIEAARYRDEIIELEKLLKNK